MDIYWPKSWMVFGCSRQEELKLHLILAPYSQGICSSSEVEHQARVLVLQEEYSDPDKMVSQVPCVLSVEPWADPVRDFQGAVVGAWWPLLVSQQRCSSFLVALD